MKSTRRTKLVLSRSTLRSLTSDMLHVAGAKGTTITASCDYSVCCESQPGTSGCASQAWSNCLAATCFDSHCLC